MMLLALASQFFGVFDFTTVNLANTTVTPPRTSEKSGKTKKTKTSDDDDDGGGVGDRILGTLGFANSLLPLLFFADRTLTTTDKPMSSSEKLSYNNVLQFLRTYSAGTATKENMDTAGSIEGTICDSHFSCLCMAPIYLSTLIGFHPWSVTCLDESSCSLFIVIVPYCFILGFYCIASLSQATAG